VPITAASSPRPHPIHDSVIEYCARTQRQWRDSQVRTYHDSAGHSRSLRRRLGLGITRVTKPRFTSVLPRALSNARARARSRRAFIKRNDRSTATNDIGCIEHVRARGCTPSSTLYLSSDGSLESTAREPIPLSPRHASPGDRFAPKEASTVGRAVSRNGIHSSPSLCLETRARSDPRGIEDANARPPPLSFAPPLERLPGSPV